MTKTTKKHFKIFVEECKRLQVVYHLGSWKIVFKHEDVSRSNAGVMMDGINSNATLFLSSEVDYWTGMDGTASLNAYIKETAKHEMIHVLINCVIDLGESRYCTKDQLITAEEGLVRKLLKLIP